MARRAAAAVGALVAVVLGAAVLQGVNAAQEIGARQQRSQAVQSYQAAGAATVEVIATTWASRHATPEGGVAQLAIRDATAAAVSTVAWYDVYTTPTPTPSH